MPIRVTPDLRYDFLRYHPTESEAAELNAAYRQDANIGFLNPESGQLKTYGSSVNNFFLQVIRDIEPRTIVEIGCGAGQSIRFLGQHDYDVIGVDPSEYSRRWSSNLGFKLVNDFFRKELLDFRPEFIYCNDVFEHVSDIISFSENVFDGLGENGVFCFATTNSQRSIALGDISMLEHQHVNMFTERSIHEILNSVGFREITVMRGSYGNTFHVVARKTGGTSAAPTHRPAVCANFTARAARRIKRFQELYEGFSACHCYVPLRSLPYLATIGDYGRSRIFDSNLAWRGKYIDGYSRPIEGLEDVTWAKGEGFFVGSLTFFNEIRESLAKKRVAEDSIFSPESLL